MAATARLSFLRRISNFVKALASMQPVCCSRDSHSLLTLLLEQAPSPNHSSWSYSCSRSFGSRPLDLPHESHGPAAIDYSSIMQEDEFHRIANSSIHELQEKLEEYGDIVQVDGFDVDYGNEVLTLKLGALGTYVLNKQTPNRQIWLSSPISGPSRFDWDHTAQAWVYRRTKANLLKLLESELEQLCGEPVNLS